MESAKSPTVPGLTMQCGRERKPEWRTFRCAISLTNVVRPRMPQSSLGLACMQFAHSSGDAPLPRLARLRALNREDNSLLVAVRQPIEELFGVRVAIERRRKVWRKRYLARLSIELNLNLDDVTSGYARALADLRTDWEHEDAARWGNRAAVRVPIDRDADSWSLARAKFFDQLLGNLDTCRGLAAKLDGGAELHRCLS